MQDYITRYGQQGRRSGEKAAHGWFWRDANLRQYETWHYGSRGWRLLSTHSHTLAMCRLRTALGEANCQKQWSLFKEKFHMPCPDSWHKGYLQNRPQRLEIFWRRFPETTSGSWLLLWWEHINTKLHESEIFKLRFHEDNFLRWECHVTTLWFTVMTS